MKALYLGTFLLMCINTYSIAQMEGLPNDNHATGEAPSEIIGATTIDAFEALQLFSQGAVFIDVRSHKMWQHGHIAGAVHLDVNTNDFMVLYLSEKLDRDTNLVFYGDSPLSIRSALASFFAGSWGYSKVHYFRDGYFSWMAADLPMSMLDAKVPNIDGSTIVERKANKTQEELFTVRGNR